MDHLVANSLAIWIGLGVGYALAYPANFGMVGLSLGLSSGFLVSAAAQGLYWRNKARIISEQSIDTPVNNNSMLRSSSPVLFSSVSRGIIAPIKREISAFDSEFTSSPTSNEKETIASKTEKTFLLPSSTTRRRCNLI